jgi:hypothetical protein
MTRGLASVSGKRNQQLVVSINSLVSNLCSPVACSGPSCRLPAIPHTADDKGERHTLGK